jgi:hypothetical protein
VLINPVKKTKTNIINNNNKDLIENNNKITCFKIMLEFLPIISIPNKKYTNQLVIVSEVIILSSNANKK